MKKYRVSLVRECTQYATVEVEAENEDGAVEAAQDWLDNGNPVDWDLSDDKGKPFVCEDDVEEVTSE